MRSCTLTFRGSPIEVVVDCYDYDPETNALDVEWHFEGMTPDEHEALAVTDAEEDDLIEQIGRRVEED